MSKIYTPILLLISISSFSQSYQKDNQVQVIIHQMIVPEDGTLEEGLALTQEWTEHVLRKNENFESIQLLLTDSESDTLDLMVLYSIKNDTKRSTQEIINELIKARWPEDEDFKNFLAQLHRYIDPTQNRRSMYRELVLE